MTSSHVRGRQRANGQGSIRKLPSGKYQWTITIGNHPDGSQRRLSGTCRTRTEAQQHLNQLLADQQRGLLRTPTTVTLGEQLDTWIQRHRPHVAPSTYEQYLYALKRVPQELRTLRLHDLSRAHLRAFQTTLTQQDLSQEVRAKTLACIRAALDHAVEDGLLTLNPAQGLRTTATVAERSRERGKALSTTQLIAFLDAAQDSPMYALFYTLFSLGLRRGEALGLRWTDVNFTTGSVHVQQQVKLERNRAVIGALKTVTSRRRLQASSDLLDVLLTQQGRVHRTRTLVGAAWSEHDLIFPSEVGTPLHPRNVNRTLKTICTSAGLPVFSSHSARHTHITQRLRRGEKVEVVAAAAGHANANITLGTYRHVMEDELRETSFSLKDHLSADAAGQAKPL